jgi:hypothetical protein
MWKLWSDETENAAKKSVKDKCMILYKNSGTVVTQHKLMKLLVIEELLILSLEALAPEEESVRILNEWRIHWCCDWLTLNNKQVINSGAMYISI